MNGSMARFLSAALLIASAAAFLQAHTHAELFPSRELLDSFPLQLGKWSGTDIELDKDVLDVLGPGDFLLRDYETDNPSEPQIDLFIAYFASQRAGDTIHSPRNCLPGAGWAAVSTRRITISVPGHAPFPANRYVIAKNDSRQLVLYWYWAHDRGVASEYWAKYYLVADSIRMNRSDGALVRIITPIRQGENADDAERRVLPFAADVVPLLDRYIPR
jgi:EpsI family protein